MKANFWKALLQAQEEQKPYVVMTLLNVRGSAPQEVGAKALVTPSGLRAGTIGGGKLEATAIAKAKEILTQSHRSHPELVTWNLQKDIKMTCGGEVQLLFEHFTQSHWNIAIFGAGHVSQALCQTLSTIECTVTVIDPRPEWLELIKFPNIHKVCLPEPEAYVPNLPAGSFILSITKGHAFDVPVLEAVSKNQLNFPFVGAIGSETKARAIKSELREKGVSTEFLERIHIPLGLPLGNNDPAEIAISITAQLLQERPGHGTRAD